MNTSYPTGGNFGSDFSTSSKTNPCPVCGRTKDKDCRISRDGKLVLCHQNFNHTNTKQPDLWHFKGETSDGRCGKYVFKEKTEKPIRPAQTRYWEYPDRNGSRLVRVVRVDDGKGKKDISQERWDKDKKRWLPGYGKDGDKNQVVRASIPVYRYAEVRKAIAKGEPIHIVEGEPCADLLWKLGLAATTNIGGGGKFTLTDSMDLQGAKIIVIVPDLDKKGIAHAEKVAEHFPEALWLYPFPTSKIWENLPKDHGLDIADWIEHEKLSATELRAAIGEKKNFKTSPAAAKVIHPEKFQVPNISELREEIEKLLESGLAPSQFEISSLAQKFRLNSKDVEKIYRDWERQLEKDDQRLDRKRDIEKLLKISDRKLTLEKYLHPSLAEPIKKVSTWMGVDPEAVLTHLLPIAAGLIHPGSRVVAKECIDFVQPLLIYSGVVAVTGSRKTPVLNIVKNPLVKLQSEEEERHKKEMAAYEVELAEFNESDKKGAPPQKPQPIREFYVDNVTVESLDKIKGNQPNQALTLIKDELSGLFASHGAYKGGRGSDKESFLSGWNGSGVKKNRCSDDSRVSLTRDSLSVTGGIQPDKLRALLGDFTDSQGEWARFLWYHMPMRPYKIPRNNARYTLGDLLEATYRKLNSLPALEFFFDEDGQNFFDDWYDKKYEQTRNEIKPGLRAAIAKMPGQAVRLIGLLHVLNGVSSQPAEVDTKISLTTVRAGCHLAEFYLGQVTLLQGDGEVLNGEPTPVLKKLRDKVEEVGSLTARQAQKGLRDLSKKTASQIREFFTELAAMDLADLQGTGSRLTLVSKKVPTSADKNQEYQNLEITRDSADNNPKVPTSADKVPTDFQQAESTTEQEFQEIDIQSADTADRFEAAEITSQPSKVESGNDTDLSSADKNDSFKEVVGTSALEDESLTQQGNKGVGNSSAVHRHSSAVDESLPTKSSAPPKNSRIFERGDRVVVKDVGGIYQGARGHVVDILESSAGRSYLVKFDKLIRNTQQIQCEASDLMKL
jgi:CRISPR-associated protein Cmr3